MRRDLFYGKSIFEYVKMENMYYDKSSRCIEIPFGRFIEPKFSKDSEITFVFEFFHELFHVIIPNGYDKNQEELICDKSAFELLIKYYGKITLFNPGFGS